MAAVSDRRKDQRRKDDADEARALPHNLEAERSVLGGILVYNPSFDKVVGAGLKVEHFYRDAHRRIFKALAYLVDERKTPADFVTLKEELARRGELDEVGGPVYVSSLADGVPRSVNVAYYAGIIIEKALLREIMVIANGAMSDAYQGEEHAADLLRKVDTAFLRLQTGAHSGTAQALKDATSALFADMEWRVQHKGEVTGVPTGFVKLDEMTRGWQRGDLIVLAARPSVGKTICLLAYAVAAASAGRRVGICSFEMRKQALHYRLLSMLSGVPLSRILGGYLGDKDYAHLSNAFERMQTLPILIDDQAGLTVEEVRSRARQWQSDEGLDLLGIDYFQLFPGSLQGRRGATRTEELAHISRFVKTRIAEDLNVPVVLLSQLKRLDGRRPTLEDLRECGALEQDADVSILLHRKNHRVSGPTEAIVAKQRNGPTGTVMLMADLDTVSMTDPPPDQPAAEPEPEEEQPPQRRRRRA